jgi:hypothetical protein
MRRVVAPRGGRDILYGEAPFGWRLSKDRSRLVKDSEEQKLIAHVRKMYFSMRLPMREIVQLLAETGVTNRRGNPFGLSRVFEMIHAPKKKPSEANGRVNGRLYGRANGRRTNHHSRS